MSGWGATDWLLLIYGLGVIVLLTRFLYQLGRLALSLRRHPAEPLTNGLWLVQNPTTASPFSFFNWVMCDPARHSPDELRQIIAHEAEHARAGHSFDLLLAELQRVALWFNPFAWVHQKLVQENLEYLADRAVLQMGFTKKEYQLNLLSAVVPNHEPPLTTSFAQSLLKKRIKMMNRKSSRAWVLGKYAALIAVLYVSAAFVAPYRQQLIDLAPVAAQPIVRALVEEVVVADEPEEAMLTPAEILAPEETVEDVTPSKQDSVFVAKSKWVQMQGDVLHWAIPATATVEEITDIIVDVKRFGSKLEISSIKYDKKQQFLTEIAVVVQGKGSTGSGGIKMDLLGLYTPIRGYSGYTGDKGLGVGMLPPEPLLSRFNESYQRALVLKDESRLEYLEDDKALFEKTKGLATVYHTREGLQKMKLGDVGIGDLNGVSKSSHNTLEVLEKYENSEFYINGNPATLKEMNEVPFDKIEKLKIAHDFKENRLIMVYVR